MTLLERMNNSIETMTLGEKFLGSLQVTLLGVTVVFLALASLFIIIMLLDKFIHQAESGSEKRKTQKAAAAAKEAAGKPVNGVPVEEAPEEDMGQLVAVITAAVAASLHTSTHNIVVKNIVRTPDTAPAWNRLGRMHQINQRVR